MIVTDEHLQETDKTASVINFVNAITAHDIWAYIGITVAWLVCLKG